MSSEPPSYLSIIQRFSSLTRLKRVIVYCIRFFTNAKIKQNQSSSRQAGPLTVGELENSLSIIIKHLQGHEFARELQDLNNRKPVSSRSPLRHLHPFVDDSGIIRVGGRLQNSSLSYSQRHPILFPTKHHFTELIIRDTHNRNLHAGSQAVLAAVRTQYQPISGRNAIRRVLRKCITCFRAKPGGTRTINGKSPRYQNYSSSAISSFRSGLCRTIPHKGIKKQNC